MSGNFMLLLSCDNHLAKQGFQVKKLPGSKGTKVMQMILWASEQLLTVLRKFSPVWNHWELTVCLLQLCVGALWGWKFKLKLFWRIRWGWGAIANYREEGVLPAFNPPALFSVRLIGLMILKYCCTPPLSPITVFLPSAKLLNHLSAHH